MQSQPSSIGVGVIGCGVIAQVMHLPYLQEIPAFHLTALCDISASQVNAVGDRYRVPPDRRFTDYRALVACPDVDAVLVLTGGTHAPAAIATAQARRHVFVEKPMCYTLDEADAMIAAAHEAGVQLMVGYMKAYDPAYEAAAELWRRMRAEDGVSFIRVHDICHDNAAVVRDLYGAAVIQEPTDDVPEEVRARLVAETRALTDIALGSAAPAPLRSAYHKFLGLLTHDTSILMLVFGAPDRVISTHVWDNGQGLLAVLDYGADLRGVLETGRGGQHWMDESLTVYGKRRHASLEFPSPYQRNAATILRVREDQGPGYVEHCQVTSYAEAFKRELEHFRDCITRGIRPFTDGQVGRQNVALAQDVIRGAHGD